jgi:hypothetical protein
MDDKFKAYVAAQNAWVLAQTAELEAFLASDEGTAFMASLGEREIEFGKDIDHGIAEIVLLSAKGLRLYEGPQGTWVAYAASSEVRAAEKGYSSITAEQAVRYLAHYNKPEYREGMSVVDWLKGRVA